MKKLILSVIIAMAASVAAQADCVTGPGGVTYGGCTYQAPPTQCVLLNANRLNDFPALVYGRRVQFAYLYQSEINNCLGKVEIVATRVMETNIMGALFEVFVPVRDGLTNVVTGYDGQPIIH